MNKTFKRVIACLLAVLMVAFSMPFTASATAYQEYLGNLNPKVNMYFWTVSNTANSLPYGEYEISGYRTANLAKNAFADSYNDYGIATAPIDYNITSQDTLDTDNGMGAQVVQSNGTLSVSTAKAQGFVESQALSDGYDTYEEYVEDMGLEDQTLGVGDVFAATLAVDDMPKVYGIQIAVGYSTNIEPVVCWATYLYEGDTTYSAGYVTQSEIDNNVVNGVAVTNLVERTSLEVVDESLTNYNMNTVLSNTRLTDQCLSSLNGEAESQTYMWIESGCMDGVSDYTDLSNGLPEDANYYGVLSDPETGEVGWAAENTFLGLSVAFKIIDEGDISFYVSDPTDVRGKGNNGFCVVDYTLQPDDIDLMVWATNTNEETSQYRNITFMSALLTYDDECSHENVSYTSNSDGTHDIVCDDCGETVESNVSCEYTSEVTTAATCVDAGVTTYTCSYCGHSYEADEPEATGVHTAGEAVIENYVDASYTETGSYDSVVYCTVCETQISRETIEIPVKTCAHENTTVINAKEASCTEEGYTGDTYCSDCDQIIATGETISVTAHTAGDPVKENEVAATCTEEGSYDSVTYCTECGAEINRVNVTTEATGHSYELTSTVDATKSAAGYYEYTCSVCSDTYQKEISALGYTITVEGNDLATITLDGEKVTEMTSIPFGTEVTIAATAVDGATIEGITVNGKNVSSSDTYTYTVTADATVSALATATKEASFTVVFTDLFGNVYSTQTVSSGDEITIPADPVRNGQTFTGWSLTANEIAALTEGATITANFEEDATTGYTVTPVGSSASSVVITIDGSETTGEAVSNLAYNTLVTVTCDGATGWNVNGAVAAYGETYSFYIGADVEVEPFSTAVTATPTVSKVSVTQISGSYKVAFLATRSMTKDCTFVSAGFVYGKNITDTSTLTLDNVGSGVYSIYCSTSSEQFSLNVGISAQTGTLDAKGFLVYTDAAGDTQVVYTEPMQFDYDA